MRRVIGKVLRGIDARRLLYYLYGPGKANEHTDPHLVAGFADPAELEPERRPSGAPDLRRLAGLLAQPLAALPVPAMTSRCGTAQYAPPPRTACCRMRSGRRSRPGSCTVPAWHPRAMIWGSAGWRSGTPLTTSISSRPSPARTASGPRIWNDFYRVREACQEAERWFGLRRTAPADRTAARRATRAESEQAARRGWAEPPRATLRREVCTAAAGAATEQEFFTRLGQAGVLVRLRHSVTTPGEVTGYAVGLPQHTARDGGVIWYGGGKLAARPDPAQTAHPLGQPCRARPGRSGQVCRPPAAASCAAEHGHPGRGTARRMRPGFFARLRESGVLVRLRFSETRSGTGHRVFRHAPRPYRAGRSTGLVWRRAARRRAHPAPAAGALEPGTEQFRGTPRSIPVHCPGTRCHLRPRVPPGRCGGGAHPPLRPR